MTDKNSRYKLTKEDLRSCRNIGFVVSFVGTPIPVAILKNGVPGLIILVLGGALGGGSYAYNQAGFPGAWHGILRSVFGSALGILASLCILAIVHLVF